MWVLFTMIHASLVTRAVACRIRSSSAKTCYKRDSLSQNGTLYSHGWWRLTVLRHASRADNSLLSNLNWVCRWWQIVYMEEALRECWHCAMFSHENVVRDPWKSCTLYRWISLNWIYCEWLLFPLFNSKSETCISDTQKKQFHDDS